MQNTSAPSPKLVADLDAFCQICASGEAPTYGSSLLGGLGLPSVDWISFSVYEARPAAEVTNTDAAYLRMRLPQVLIAAHKSPLRRTPVEDKLTLLAAVEKHDCWEDCLRSRDESYALAQLLIDTAVFYTVFLQAKHLVKSSVRVALASHAEGTESRIIRLLNLWIKPAVPWLGMPSSQRIGEALFGIAWWAFNAPTTYDCNGLLRRTQPPFVAGFVSWIDEQAQCELPAVMEARAS